MIELAALMFLLVVVFTVVTLAGALLKLVFWAILLWMYRRKIFLRI